tara:strand:+ start:422 stop:1126 length:705 start_codon:yes stop_codon:yes gene_type:complete
MSILNIEHLCAFYGKAQALHDISLRVPEGAIVALIGANGAGKSTLLDSIVGLTKTTGSIIFDSYSISNMGTDQIIKKGIGYAPERFNLFPYMTVEDNLLVGAYTARSEIENNLSTVHKLFPRLLERANQETYTQSGGERQMVSLGRALMTNPKLLLVDEPTIGLAPKVCQEIANAIKSFSKELGLTVVMTEQNANFALSLAQHVYVLDGGRITVDGTPSELKKDLNLAKTYFGL